MPMPGKSVLLFDQTSAANAAVEAGNLVVEDYDALLIEVIPSGTPTGGNLTFADGPVSGVVQSLPVLLSGAAMSAAWALGSPAGASSRYIGGIPSSPPSIVTIHLDALGVGITGRLRVIGRRNFRGPSISANPD